MMKLCKNYGWILETLAGSALFALGFALFLQPNDLNSGGVSGLALVAVEVTGLGSVGTLSILLNLPLFLMGGLKIGKRFFWGSLLGMLVSSVLIDVFSLISMPVLEPLLCTLYGGVLCGLGLGVVFVGGTSTGGSDILVRLLKLRYRSVPVGQISMCFDMCVVVLTGLVFRDLNKALYTGLTVFISSQVIDAVVYRFDYSRVVLIVSDKYEEIVDGIGLRLDRGSTVLYGEGGYTGKPRRVVMTAVKRQQIAELKELVMGIDPEAFVIVQEAHQVLGDGFARYSKNAL